MHPSEAAAHALAEEKKQYATERAASSDAHRPDGYRTKLVDGKVVAAPLHYGKKPAPASTL